MSRAILRRLLFCAVMAWVRVPVARAFSEACTHPALARNSARLLDAVRLGGYGEMVRAELIERLGAGARDEDRPASRVVNHFYHAPDGRALDVPGVANFFMDFAECVPGSGGAICANEDAVTRALRFRANAIDRWRSGDKPGAYHWLGRSMHLLADLHQPAHVHNDAHLPWLEHDQSTLEAFVAPQRRG